MLFVLVSCWDFECLVFLLVAVLCFPVLIVGIGFSSATLNDWFVSLDFKVCSVEIVFVVFESRVFVVNEFLEYSEFLTGVRFDPPELFRLKQCMLSILFSFDGDLFRALLLLRGFFLCIILLSS